ncbi:amidohydrolase family protein [Paramicrobacterium agarici]|uniref:amidohydrolase family protein n=1 Tax=Paramicrobacterium agarici TaxID=630514 RepID=UPI001150F7C8|nr:amidohydrolase family protein [Microbacterium agarici]TQO22660.1 putative TIM-barrel fold metal-dependent hydrolase [Microbacterium agarici]
MQPTDTAVFDAHFHIVDPAYPLIPNNGYLPDAFTADDYVARTAALGVTGGAVVSGSFQGTDQSYLVAALERLGPGFVGVTQLSTSVSDDEITRLDAAGVRAVRFNLYRGATIGLAEMEHFATRVHDVAGWHSELYVDASDLPDLAETLRRLPQASVDHLGMTDDASGTLLSLVEGGLVVKATGFGRMSVSDPDALMATIDRANPHALIFGTDLPSTRAAVPFADSDLDRVRAAVGDGRADAVMWHNARRFYRFSDTE